MRDRYYNEVIPSNVPLALVYDLDVYDPLADEDGDSDLYVVYHELHQRNLPSVFWTRYNGGHWVARTARANSDVLADPAGFSSKRPLVPDDHNFKTPFFVPLMADPPDHAGYRAIVQPLLSPKRISEIESKITAFVVELIEGFRERGECEYMAEFALQMPIAIFLQLLDLPLSDREKLLDAALRVIRPPDGQQPGDALQEIFAYLQPILAERYGVEKEDIVSKLVNGRHQGRLLSSEEQLGLTATVLIGGMDTVAATLGFVAQYLAEHPKVRSSLAESPDKTKAIDEFFRRFSVVTVGRHATKNMNFHGAPLQAGDHIITVGALHNLDDHEFPDPLAVDFERRQGKHATFGSGIHFCLGAFLARLELRIFLDEWLKRIPVFWIKPSSERIYNMGTIKSLKKLHLTWRNE